MNLANFLVADADPTLVGAPISGANRTNAIQSAVAADEAALFGTSNAVTDSDILLTALATPAAPVITQGGTAGNTNYSYGVTDVSNVGSASSTATQTTTGNATLSTTNTNIVTFASIIGHTYRVIRTAASGTPNSTGLIATVTATAAITVVTDTGITATGGVPAGNLTGCILAAGPVLTGGGTNGAVSATSGATLTVAQMLAGVIVRTGPSSAGFTDTTPTAAQLVAALPGVTIGSSFRLVILNKSNQTLTVAGGTGVTTTNDTLTVATVNAKEFLAVFTAVAVGSEAVYLYSMGAASAY
jgi:hypothetical protein